MKYSKKENLLKKSEGVPLLNFVGSPGVPLLNFGRSPGVPFLNFMGVPGPTFKLWGGFRVPGPEVLVPLLHHALLNHISSSFLYKQPPEMFCKKRFLKILQNSLKNTCVRVFF